MATQSRFDEVMELFLKRGFLLPSCEIYNQMAGFYDYGPLGCAVRNKILAKWRDFCIRQEGFVEIDGSTILKGAVLEASGHATQFVDPIVKCTKCKEAFRADHLVGEAVKGKFSAEGLEPNELDKIIKEKGLRCPRCGNVALGQVEVFNLMFKVGVGAGEGTVAYLRPETAQSIFCDFHRVFKAERERLPLGIAQVGKAYRNEISPRQGLLRMREFTQMEIEIFVDPEKIGGDTPANFMGDAKIRLLTQKAQTNGTEDVVEMTAEESVAKGIVPNRLMAHWIAKEMAFYLEVGIPFSKMRMRHMLPKETPFYSKANFDMEVETSAGWKETIGNAYRTDHDLSTHSKHSGKDLSVMTKDGRRVMPHCIEPSWGFDRLFYCIMEHAYVPKGEREWAWLKLPRSIAPYTAIVCPLMNKDELAAKAQSVYNSLIKEGFDVLYDTSGNIGKRYARADEVGIPFAITIDYDTLNDNAVTVRDRDTTKQERVKIDGLAGFLKTA